MLEFLIHNAIAIRIRQKLFGWKVAQRHGVEIWFQKIRVYPGYREYDYEPMLERAWMIARNNKKKFPGLKVAVKVETFYSSGRPGIGVRKVHYTIMPYKEVFG